MVSSEETEDEIWVEYTDRHKRRLAYKRSLNEFKKILKKVAENRNSDIPNNDDNKMNFACNSDIDAENVVVLQDRGNINIQISTENYESVNEEICNTYNTSEESEVSSEYEENVSINNKVYDRK